MALYLLGTLLSLVLSADGAWVEPWYCHGIDCPVFTETNMTIDNQIVEIRTYETAMWTSTIVMNTDLQEAENIGFNRDFDYIDGENADNASIPMTAPVLTYVNPGQGPNCQTNFTVSFYVPYAYQAPHKPPPQPTESTVFLNTYPKMTVGVLSFDGFGDQDVVIAKAAQLSNLLSQTDLKYDTINWFCAGYDPPFRITDRHNEVWIQIYN